MIIMERVAIRTRASQIFFILILLQIPLFGVPCRSAGTCRSPLQVTAAQLATSRMVPKGLVKVMLYPGACICSIFASDSALPCWSTLFEHYNLHDLAATHQVLELNHLEVLIGSYFAVAGAIAGLFEPGRMSFFGVLLIVWGLIKEGVFERSGKQPSVYISPLMLLAVVCVSLALKYDKQKAQRSSPKPLLALKLSLSESKL